MNCFNQNAEQIARDKIDAAKVLKAFEVVIEEIPANDYEDFYQKFIDRHL